MTALAGFWSKDGSTEPGVACERMLRAQQIYAPDAAISRSAGPAAVGRRLFRLLPEDIHDRGPVISASGAILVADVRLDNRDELLGALGITGPEARSLADAAILSRALERWDTGALDHVVGDFAFAQWDEGRRRLLLARDYLGQRPLHLCHGPGFVAFASMPKGLHALPDVPRIPDRRAAAEFLALLPRERGSSFFEGIETVPPGAYVEATQDQVRVVDYWRPDLTPLSLRSAGEYDEALRERLDEAVSSRLRRATGHVGSHLSGGLDSAAVTATTARALASRDERLTAFTSVPREGYGGAVPPNVIHDEGTLAAEVAALYPNIDHVLIRGCGRSPFEALDRYFFLCDRPALNLCNLVWINAIDDAARTLKVSVLLTGLRGNAGFSYTGTTLLPQLLRQLRLIPLARHWTALLRGGTRAGTLASQTFGPLLPQPLWRLVLRARGRADGVTGYTNLTEEVLQELDIEKRAVERGLDLSYRPRSDGVSERLWMLRRGDVGNDNKGALAGWGIDRRDPTADRRLVEFCLRVPAEQYLAGGAPRGFARRALADRLPPEILVQRRKGLQAVDWHEGLTAAKAELQQEVDAIGELPESLGMVAVDRMKTAIRNWPASADWRKARTVERYRLALLRGVAVGHFLRRASGSNG